MKRFFGLLVLLSLLVLAACSDTTPEVTPTPEAAGFRFDIDPSSQQVSVTAVGMAGSALNTQQAGGARLLEPFELTRGKVSVVYKSGNVATISAVFRNVTTDESFSQPFTFRPARTPQQGNYLSSTEPGVTDADLGGDGVLSPGESTSTLTFTVKHNGVRFSYFVNAYAVVEDVAVACNDQGVLNGSASIRTQLDVDGLRDCREITGRLFISSDASTLDFSPLDGLQKIGVLTIANTSLTSISGFGGLTILNEFNIRDNPDLTSVSGFENLESVEDGLFGSGDFIVARNPVLVSLPDFGALSSISGIFSVVNNPALVSFPELGGLNTVVAFSIKNNDALTSLPAFEQLSSVGVTLAITNNDSLTSISSFENLSAVGKSRGPSRFVPGFFINNNDALVSISGFNSLESNNVRVISQINDNGAFDCSIPPQSNLPFLPVDESTGNLVNCPTEIDTE